MLQFSTAVRNACVKARHDLIGSGAKLQIFTGTIPASPASASTGTKLAEILLPFPFMVAGVAGQFVKTGTWSTTGLASAVSGYFRIVDSAGVCHHQGTTSQSGGGGDLILDNVAVGTGQTVTVDTYTFLEGGA